MEDTPKTVDVAALEKQLADLHSDATAEQLFKFGLLLMTEVQQRTGQIDSKLTSTLGWTSAMLAFLILGTLGTKELFGQVWLVLVVLLAIIAATSATLCAFLGLRTQGRWPVPSEIDWFQPSLLGQPERLKRYHILSMLEVRRAHNAFNIRKARLAHSAEICMVMASASTAAVLFVRLIGSL